MICGLEADGFEDLIDKVFQAVGVAGGDDVVACLVLLKNAPHGVDVLGCPAPIPVNVEIAEMKFLVASVGDADGGGDDFGGNEAGGPKRRFVIEEDAVGGMEAVGLSIGGDEVKGGGFGDAVGTAGAEGVNSSAGVSVFPKASEEAAL